MTGTKKAAAKDASRQDGRGSGFPDGLSRAELAQLAEAGADWCWETDSDLRFSWLSPNYRQVTGIDPDTVIGHFRFDFLSQIAQGSTSALAHMEDLQARRPFRDFVYELNRGRKQCRWISTTGFPRFDEEGRFLGYRGVGHNITGTALSLASLHAIEPVAGAIEAGSGPAGNSHAERMMATLNIMSDACCYYDSDERLVLYNEAMVSMYRGLEDVIRPGVPFSELIDKGIERELWDMDDLSPAQWRKAVLSARAGARKAQSTLKFSDGRSIMQRTMPTEDGGRIGICTDITELEDRRVELDKASEKTSRLLFDLERTIDSMTMGVVLLDADLNAEIINQAFFDIWKLQPGQVPVGSPFRALIDINRQSGIYDVKQADWERYIAKRLKEIRAGDVAPREFRRADGCTIIYSVTALSGGKRLVSYYDVTEMKNREAELAKTHERSKLAEAVINGIKDPIFVKDNDLKFVFVNEAFSSLFGVAPGEMLGRPANDFLPAAEVAEFEASERRVLDTGERYEVEEDFDLSGTEGSRLVRKNRVSMESGNDYVACFLFDISELRKREEALRASMKQIELFRHVLDELPVSTYVKTADLAFEFVNKAWTAMTGVSQGAALGRTDRDFFGAEGEGFAQRDMLVLQTGKLDETEETLTHADGSVRQLIARKSRLISADGTVHLIGSSTDISELKQREIELQEARSKAVLADRAKSEFLANMSHEIRTPMNGVLGMAELLAKSTLDPKQKTFTDIIVKSGNALLTIINDILDFSKIDAGQLVLDPMPFNLAEAIEDVATLVSTRAKEKDLELIVRIEPHLHDLFVGDVGRIRQIITNLVGNAVKFTDSGHVLIDVTGTVVGDNTDLRIAVTDTGIGIPADKLDLVFEKFSQVDASSTRRHEGTGLGLAITSRLVDLMGGRIGVGSREGEGSTFWFTLTLANAGSASGRRVSPVDVTGARILIVDDNAVNRAILMEQMASWRFDACAAESGREGLKIMAAATSYGLPVDCVVLDYQMPEMSGAEIARIIRATPYFSDTPIVMLTSVDQSLASASYRDVEIDAQLIKPARSAALLETLVSTIQKHRAKTRKGPGPAGETEPDEALPAVEAVRPRSRPVRADGHRLDILVAEDNEVNQLVFTQILGETDFTFQIVGNGRLAVSAFGEMNPRMILMDVSMPEMNGLEATAAIRQMERETARHIPIIGVTAHALKGDRERCIEAGMDDYLHKPISPKALLEKIERWAWGGEQIDRDAM